MTGNASQTLPLTAFERLQFWETQDGFPNQIVAVLDFVGPFEPDRFRQAAELVVSRHPLLYSRVRSSLKRSGDVAREFAWPATSEMVIDDYLDWSEQAADWQPGDSVVVPDIHPQRGPGFRLSVQFNATHCRWIMQTHHGVCDGVGGLQAIREVLQTYHWLSRDSMAESPLRPLNPQRLLRRGRGYGPAVGRWWQRLAKWPMKWIGLFGASKFLWRRPVSIEALDGPLPGSVPQSSSPESPTAPSADLAHAMAADLAAVVAPSADPAISPDRGGVSWVEGELSVSQSQRLRQQARDQGVTVNSWVLAHWLVALDLLRRQCGRPTDRDWYRLIIPTNERTAGDVALPACNQVSMVYVDRRPGEMEHIDGLAKGIDFEMSVIRRFGLSGTFVLAIRLLSWVPGLLRWYARRPSCWATSYVTNLGPILDRLRVGQQGELSQVGDLVLQQIRLLPPLRPGLPAALAVHFYASRLCFTLHYQPERLPAAQAKYLLAAFLNRLRTQ